MRDKTFRPDRVKDYFLAEWKVLLFVTASGLIYNMGLLAGPWFEGKMTGELVDILTGSGTMKRMAALALCYVVTVLIVQGSRYFKRFYVRRFANNVSRRMKQILYAKLVTRSRESLTAEGEGSVMTKAISEWTTVWRVCVSSPRNCSIQALRCLPMAACCCATTGGWP